MKCLEKTIFPKKEFHVPKCYIIDCYKKNLGVISSVTAKFLIGKNNSFYSPGLDQGNYVILLNVKNISYLNKKGLKKFYYRNSQRPGSLKKENFISLLNKNPIKIFEESVFGMLPKTKLGKILFSRLFIYENNVLNINKNKLLLNLDYIKLNI